ncbi:Cu/Pi carrier [Saitoella coloradoensis]
MAFPAQDKYWIPSVVEDAKNKATVVKEDAKTRANDLAVDAKDRFAATERAVKANVVPRKGIELYSGQYYTACMIGGILACGTTHTLVTPLDLVKCRRQVDASLYKSNMEAWRNIYRAEGMRGIFTGYQPTFIGYSFQGAGKYGFYELFKKTYADALGPDSAVKYRTFVYLAASASAEVIADVLLCPWEAIKVRMQTSIPPFAKTTREGWGKITGAEGLGGLYKGLSPLWARQIPYTMMKFASFERTVEAIYNRLPKKKSEYSKLTQTGVSFLGGYIAGILCAVISHPADVMVSKMNANKNASEPAGAAIKRIYGEIGFGGLWNGLPVRILMIGTLTGLQWLIYDSFKVALGLPTTGSTEEKETPGVPNK